MTEGPGEELREGLDGVLACESSVCRIDGASGLLLYRGYDFRSFAVEAEFLSVVLLLWHGEWPSGDVLAEFSEETKHHRDLNQAVADLLPMITDGANPMAVMRTVLSVAGVLDQNAEDSSPESVLRSATTLISMTPTVVASMARLTQGKDPVEPRRDLGHAANFLYMLHGEEPTEGASAALNTVLNTYAEHELNASTFAARTAVGTLSDYYSAVVAACSTLKGALHGGAIDDSMHLFREIGELDNVSGYIEEALTAKRKVPGFGHRVYRTRDPRAYSMEELARVLGEESGETQWYQIARSVEQELLERKGLNPNVDYYSAIVLYHLGFPLDLLTSFIVTSRLAGWTAHICEQFESNRLIRPRARYVGSTERLLK
jgi:citrate synthase